VFLFIKTTKAQISYTWNGSVSTVATNPANWSPNGVPGPTDNATIVTGSNICLLNISATIANFTVTSGTLDLGSNTLTINGATAIFTSGTVQNGTITVSGAATTTFGNGTVTMNCIVNVTSAAVTFRNTTFQQPVNITKTGASNDASNGNNIFNGPATITNAGSGYLLMANSIGDRFNAAATFNNIGSSNIFVAYNGNNNIFGGVATFNNSPTANNLIYVSQYATNTIFNNNIVVNSNNGQGVQFCNGSTGASVLLAPSKTISAGVGGFSAGTLLLKQFTQAGPTPQSITLTGNATANFISTTFNGVLAVNAPNIYTSNSSYNGATILTKTDGTSSNASGGGNTFNSTLTVNYTSGSGNGYWSFGNGAADIYNGDVYSNNNSLDRIIFGHNSANNQFNGNFIVTQVGSSAGTALTWNLSSSCVMATGKTISIGGAGFSSGYLAIQGFTQNGNAAINLASTGTSSIYVGAYSSANPSVIGGSLTLTSPDIYIRGGTFNAPVSLSKTGGNDNHNNGFQNIFNSTLAINQQSSGGYFMLGYNSNDLFNENITLTSTASGGIYLGWTSGTGTPTLAAGKTILVGAGGFSDGFLSLNTFTQLGNTPMNLAFTGSGTFLRLANNSVVGGDLVTNTPDIFFNGCTFNEAVDATKTGASGDNSQGGNIFNGVCNITNSSSGYLILGSNNPDTWNDDVTFTNNGSERILAAYQSTGNQFNGNIYVNTSGSAKGIYFCGGNTTATATLASGKAIQAGVTGLNAGYLILRQFTQLGNASVNLTLNATATYLQFGPNAVFGGNVVSSSPGLYFNGCTFNGIVNSTKTGATTDGSSGNNVFNGASTFTNAGSGYLMFGNGNADQFNAASTFNNTGSDNIYVAYNSSNNIFGGVATFNNTPTGNTGIYVSLASSGTVFNDNISVTSTNGQGVQFCDGTGNATLVAGKKILIGAGGFTAGTLLLRQFTQVGATPQSLLLTGTGNLTFGPVAAFGGNITSLSPSLYFNGGVFNGTVNSTKTGAANNTSNGNNIFNDICVFTNSGAGQLLFGNVNPDQFNSASTFNNTGSSNLYVAYNSSNNVFGGVATFNNTPTANTTLLVSPYSTGTVFNSNIVVTSANGQGVQFCANNGTASATLVAGNTISVGAGGFSSGTLLLKQFNQVGSQAQNIISTGTSNITYGPSSSFGGNVTSVSPSLYLNGCTFNGSTNITKNGTTGDFSQGGNIFNGICGITNSGSSFLLLGNTSPDLWNNDVTFTDNGSERLLPCWATAGNQFNGNIYVNTSGGATGISFCGGNATATATQAASKTFQAGLTGLNAGYLVLKQFTQLGNAAISLTLSSTATYLQFGPGSTIGGNVVTSSPGLYFNGCTFSGTVNSVKTGATSDASIGNNVFNGAGTFTNAGSGYLMFGNGNADQFNAVSTFNNSGSGDIYVAHNSSNNIFGGAATFNNTPTGNNGVYVSRSSSGTVFNDDISVTSTNGQGVQFCGSTGTATLSSGKKILVGPGGFTAGTLLLRQFTQIGATPQSLTLTGSSNLTFGPVLAFGGNVTTSSPSLFFNGCAFSGIVNSTKTGTSSDQSQGGNTFNKASTFTNSGTGYLMMTTASPDAYNSDVTFVKNNSGLIYPNYNNNSTYSGNVTISSTTAVTFGVNSGTATFNGSGLQNINVVSGTPTPVFTRLVINNTSGSGVTLNNTSISVSNNLTLSSGLLNTTTSNILTMLNGSTTAAGTSSSTSYVNGPMRYQKASSGTSVLNFPIGNSPDCRPVVLTLNHSNGALYTYEAKLFNADARALGYTLPPTVDRVSGVHYYTIGRTDASGTNQPIAGLSGNQIIQIFFDNNDVVTDGGTLTIVKNTYITPTAWIDIGGTAGPFFTGSPNLIGSITSTSTVSAFNSFSTFALADVLGGMNVLPTLVVNFTAVPNINKVDLTWSTGKETNNSFFTIEKSRDAVNFEFFQNIATKALNGNSANTLNYKVQDANPYSGTSYYRLKQTDQVGNIKYWNIVAVTMNQAQSLSVYPNPTTGKIFISGLSISENHLTTEWYDLSGRLLLARNNLPVLGGIARLDVQLSEGIYILRYLASDGIIHQQRVIVKK